MPTEWGEVSVTTANGSTYLSSVPLHAFHSVAASKTAEMFTVLHWC